MTRLVAAVILFCVLLPGCRPPAPETPPLDREAFRSHLPERPFSEAVRVGDTYYFSGKLGVTEETLAMTSSRIQAETRNIMENFADLFLELGVGFDHVVKGTVYLADVADYGGMNQVYGEYFLSDPPARECVGVGAGNLLNQALVEISFVAVVPD